MGKIYCRPMIYEGASTRLKRALRRSTSAQRFENSQKGWHNTPQKDIIQREARVPAMTTFAVFKHHKEQTARTRIPHVHTDQAHQIYVSLCSFENYAPLRGKNRHTSGRLAVSQSMEGIRGTARQLCHIIFRYTEQTASHRCKCFSHIKILDSKSGSTLENKDKEIDKRKGSFRDGTLYIETHIILQ